MTEQNLFHKELGKKLWQRVQLFLSASYIDESIQEQNDRNVLLIAAHELADVKEYAAALEALLAGFEIPHPLRDTSEDPIDLESVKTWVDLAKMEAPGIDFRRCYKEDVPRLLRFITDLRKELRDEKRSTGFEVKQPKGGGRAKRN